MAIKNVDELIGQPIVLPNFVDFTTYIPTFSAPFGVVPAHSFQYSEKLTAVDVIGTLTTGTVDNGACRFTLPNSYTATRTQVVGQWWCYSNSNTALKRGTLYSTAGSNEIRFGIDEKTSLKAPFSDEPTRSDLGFFSAQQINVKIENMPITQLVALGGYRAYGAGINANGPSLVQGYEFYEHASTYTGPFAAQSRTMYVTKIGKFVTINVPEIRAAGGNTSAPIAMTTALPARFRPRDSVYFPVFISNSVDQNALGYLAVAVNGAFTAGVLFTAPNFAATTNTVGIYGTSISYQTA